MYLDWLFVQFFMFLFFASVILVVIKMLLVKLDLRDLYIPFKRAVFVVTAILFLFRLDYFYQEVNENDYKRLVLLSQYSSPSIQAELNRVFEDGKVLRIEYDDLMTNRQILRRLALVEDKNEQKN